MTTGRITTLDPRGFGFIEADGAKYFFPAREVRGSVFDTLTEGTVVTFKPVKQPYNNKGPRALTVTVVTQEQVAA